MSPEVDGYCNDNKVRDLGKGDILGLRAIY